MELLAELWTNSWIRNLLYFFSSFVVLSILFRMFSEYSHRRCRNKDCGRKMAGELLNRTIYDSNVQFVEIDKNYIKTVITERYTYDYKCKYCGHEWTVKSVLD